MIQVHTIILWAEVRNEDFRESAERAYDLMMALKDFGTELSPNYLRVMRKKDAKLFEWSYEAFEERLRKGVNKEGKTIFSELGYSIGFFSSLCEDDSAGISLHVGTSNPKFNNNFIVNLPISLPVYSDTIICDRLAELFKKCVIIFNPFWGCISNSFNSNRYKHYLNERTTPTAIHWFNYFGEKITENLKINKIEKAPAYAVEKINNGYFLRIKQMPIDDTNEEDINLQNKLNVYFGIKPI